MSVFPFPYSLSLVLSALYLISTFCPNLRSLSLVVYACLISHCQCVYVSVTHNTFNFFSSFSASVTHSVCLWLENVILKQIKCPWMSVADECCRMLRVWEERLNKSRTSHFILLHLLCTTTLQVYKWKKVQMFKWLSLNSYPWEKEQNILQF